jgi:carboxypeptidase Q
MKSCPLACLLALAPMSLAAQTFAVPNPVLERMWRLGMDSSQTYPLAQALMDSIGPRLTGTPGQKAGNDWLVATYQRWGIPARNERYGTWRGWRRGVTHVDLIAPRVRSLEATMLAWSPGTKGDIEGPIAILPSVASTGEFEAWLPQAKGRFVLISFPQPTCRPDSSYKSFATPETFERMTKDREQARQAWSRRIGNTGLSPRELPERLEQAGALGVLTSLWSQGWGVTKVFNARTTTVPTLDLSCEDYGLVFRLAERNQGAVLRVKAEAEALGEVPVFNTIAEIRGVERPNEYVMLSAHFDSWDGASGATDNGTGTITMLEAMRILKTAYPRPKRTILVGHWSGEEQGLVGSRAFAADNPKVVRGLQALFNQDNGTGRVTTVSMQGLTGAGAYWARWLTRIPTEITRHITLQLPGAPRGGGSDDASLICHGAPAFSLSSLSWEYGTYTWHTNRDTFDKVIFDDLRNNATLTAMLAYLASEEPQLIPREQRMFRGDAQLSAWPTCQVPPRSSGESTRE